MPVDPNLRRFTGIDVLMAARAGHWRAGPYAADEVTWAKWAGRGALELWQLVALHSALDPDSLGIGIHGVRSTFLTVAFFDSVPVHPPPVIDPDDPLRRLSKNLQSASEAFACGHLKEHVAPHSTVNATPSDTWANGDYWDKRVAVSDFHAWSLRVNLPVVDGWPARSSSDSGRRWPWDSHETQLLRELAEIGEHWRLISEGGKHDPDDESTVPKSEVIEPLLEAKGISEKVRQAMFTILRPDGLRPGPRRRRVLAK